MIRWVYEQMDMFTYWFEIRDEHGRKIYPNSTISSPAISILKEILTDYLFAKEINNTDKIFNYDDLSKEDQMDIRVCCIHKLEDSENDGQ